MYIYMIMYVYMNYVYIYIYIKYIYIYIHINQICIYIYICIDSKYDNWNDLIIMCESLAVLNNYHLGIWGWFILGFTTLDKRCL